MTAEDAESVSRPIIFSGPMVRALLAGRKTMTRRLAWNAGWKGPPAFRSSIWQRVRPGDRLWVRETMNRFQTFGAAHPTCHFPADNTAVSGNGFHSADASGRAIWLWKGKTLPSIHMPRWASRLTLIVTATKVERIKSITEADARAEGVLYVPGHGVITPSDLAEGYSNYLDCRMGFEVLWNELHGAGSWESDPEVVAISFAVHQANIDALPKVKAA